MLDEPDIVRLADQLPLQKGAQIVVFGDSLTAHPQSWAVILAELLAAPRPDDALTESINAIQGEMSAHGLSNWCINFQPLLTGDAENY